MLYFNVPLLKNKIFVFSTELNNPTPLYIGYDIENQFLKYLNQLSFDRIFMFCDELIYKLYGEAFFNQIASHCKNCELVLIPQGEHSKSFDQLESACENLIEKGVSKKSILISFGGGVIGNLVGMISGLVYRGIRFIEVPTTMTGQTDSVLSDKQAVNGRTGKNHFGFYHSPVFIWADTKYLMTDPPRSRRSGIIEGLKNGLINDVDFLGFLDKNLKKDLSYSEEEIYSLAFNIIISKLHILRQDPSEKHFAIILEYGHTFGHAIEWLAACNNVQSIQHGEAVAIGMKIAAELSYTLGHIDAAARDLHYYMIDEKVGSDAVLPAFIDDRTLINAMIGDNKKTGRQIQFILLEKLGQCLNPNGDYLVDVDLEVVKDVYNRFRQRQEVHDEPLRLTA